MAEEIRALKANVEAMHTAQSLSAKDAAALGNLKTRLDAVKTETSAAIAEVAGTRFSAGQRGWGSAAATKNAVGRVVSQSPPLSNVRNRTSGLNDASAPAPNEVGRESI
jgi:hypothetical protein